MKLIITVLLGYALYFCSLKEKDNKVLDLNKSKTFETNQTKKYKSIFYKTALQSKNLNSYINQILKTDKRIVNIIFNNKTNTLTYYVLEDTSSQTNDFYGLAKTIDFDWTYYLYHDIYKASLYFKKVNNISIYDNTNKRNITFLPAKSDIYLVIEKGLFKRNIYVENLDYNSLNIDCSFNKNGDCIILLNSIYKKIEKRNSQIGQ